MTRPTLLALGASLPVLLPVDALAQDADSRLLTGAEVVTMQGGWTEPQALDILIEDGRIAEIGPDLAAEGAEEIDLSGHVITPGLVDGHWHMWNTIARGMARSERGGFSQTMGPLAKVWTPEASALSVKLGMALAVNSGITWVNNWAHNTVSPAHADAEVAAMRDSGVRGRFSYGYPQAAGEGEVMDLVDLRATAEDWESGRIGLGVSLRGPDRSEPEVWQTEITTARELGLPVTFHMGGSADAAAQHNAQALDEEGMLGEDIHVVHMTSAPRADLQTLAESGSPLIISPWTEMQVGYGVPNPALMQSAGLDMAVSVDNTVLAGQINMFEVMRLTADLGDGFSQAQQSLTDATVFDWASRQGAASVQAPEGVGVLQIGGPADLIAVDTESLNTQPSGSMDFLLTHAADPEDVSFVMIGGEVHKQDGALTRVDIRALTREAVQMLDEIKAAAADG
ncbi:amidohydrolase family protein [Alloyangia pacifica]|uniref:amidohydrolase family protein n=1 Tax=Alloyangia pacifica TaxID=311180 RepID=UPI001CD3DF3D|nr:amidohydrolase family protein [Alloyangia pacifica]MCA0995722.1 amidohydrolase family protein [Alloyangia pacifica]